MTKTKEIKVSELVYDDMNFNKGTQQGNELMKNSFSKFGAGRSILIDKNNRIISGNKSTENANLQGIEDVIVIETTGKQLVAVKRVDIDLDTDEGREMAMADNATAKSNIDWDFEAIDKWNNDEIVDDWIIREEHHEFVSDEINVDEKLEAAQELGIEKDYLMIVFKNAEEFEDCRNLLNLKRQVENKAINGNNEGIQRIINYENLRTLIK